MGKMKARSDYMEELQIYKEFYEQVVARPRHVHCGAKLDYIKARILDVQEKLMLLPADSVSCSVDIKR